MINYTEHVRQLMSDIVQRVPRLSFLDMNRILVFARSGRADREGPYATCHCICLPPSDPGYYFWRDQTTGALKRRSEWFVTKSPTVRVCGSQIEYMVSFTLPRFCDPRRVSASKRSSTTVCTAYAATPSSMSSTTSIRTSQGSAESSVRTEHPQRSATARLSSRMSWIWSLSI